VVLELLTMPARPNPVLTTGTLLRRHGERTWMTVLPNGAETLAHIPTWKLDSIPVLQEGDRVRLEMTQYDFSTARIAGKAGT
jgi:translation initiation factor IF-1